jgi:hypothetical protein
MTGEGGRPSKLTPEVRKKLLDGLRCGLSRAAAATRAGIGARTFREWMARTDAAEPYASLRTEVEAVEADCEGRLAAVVFRAALKDPNQARWLLERRFPASWGRRQPEENPSQAAGAGGIRWFLRPADDTPAPPWKKRTATTGPEQTPSGNSSS